MSWGCALSRPVPPVQVLEWVLSLAGIMDRSSNDTCARVNANRSRSTSAPRLPTRPLRPCAARKQRDALATRSNPRQHTLTYSSEISIQRVVAALARERSGDRVSPAEPGKANSGSGQDIYVQKSLATSWFRCRGRRQRCEKRCARGNAELWTVRAFAEKRGGSPGTGACARVMAALRRGSGRRRARCNGCRVSPVSLPFPADMRPERSRGPVPRPGRVWC